MAEVTVSLEMPIELENPVDVTDREAMLEAVRSFQGLAAGSPNLYVYVLKNDRGEEYLVDMANGPNITRIKEGV